MKVKHVSDVINAIRRQYGEAGKEFSEQLIKAGFSEFGNKEGEVEIIFEELSSGDETYYLLMENDYEDPNSQMKIVETFIPNRNIHTQKQYALGDDNTWIDLNEPKDYSNDYEFAVVDEYEYYPGVKLKNAAIVTEYHGNDTVVEVPAELGEGSTSAIDGDAFVDNDDIGQIKMPNVDSLIMHECSIENCQNLTRVTINSKNTFLESCAIADCENLKSFN